MKLNISKIFRLKKGYPIYFIAEIGVNHGGSLNLAKKMIIEAKKAGANAVKFQTFKAEKLVTPQTPKVKYQKKTTPKKQSHYEMIKSLELNFDKYKILKNFCSRKKIDFLSTPYDVDSAKFLSKLGCKYFKTASADIVDFELHHYLAKTKKSVIISTGMSNLKEIDDCLKIYRKYKNKNIILLHCVSNYPCSLNSLNLNVMPMMASKFKCNVGFSDHTIGHQASATTAALGGKVIEKHFTTNKMLSGPDQKTSALPGEFKNLIDEVRKVEVILGKNIKKCQKEELEMSKISRKSLTLNVPLKKNKILKKEYISLKRPGTGLLYRDLKKVLGKKARKKLKINYQFKVEDFKRI